MRLRTLALLMAAVTIAPAKAVTVREGRHPGFSRLVYEFDEGTSWKIGSRNNTVSIDLDQPVQIPPLSRLPPNFIRIDTGPGTIRVTVDPSSRVHEIRIGNRLVLDAYDPPLVKRPKAPAADGPPPEIVHSPPVDRHDDPPPSPPLTLLPSQLPQPSPNPNFALAAVPSTAHHHSDDIVLPFGTDVGVAALRDGRGALVVFDVERPIDISQMKERPDYAGASVTVGSGVTTLFIPLTKDQQFSLFSSASRWNLSFLSNALVTSIVLESGNPALLRVPQAGKAVKVIDPETGGILLLGTVHTANAAIQLGRATPLFNVLPTIVGVALEPLSDRISLEPRTDGFAVEAQSSGLHLTHDTQDLIAQERGAELTTASSLPDQPESILFPWLRRQMTQAALAPPLARAQSQLAAARTMIALGLGPEANAELALATLQDPTQAHLPEIAALRLMASVLSDRSVTLPVDLPSTDETTLWLALRDAHDPARLQTAGQKLAVVWPLVLSYSTKLRNRLLPRLAETLVSTGQLAAAQALLQAQPDLPSLALARGMLAQARGESDKALSIYAPLISGPDPLLRVEAGAKTAEIRVSKNLISKQQAADIFDRLSVAWHGGEIERHNRLRLADLLSQTGQWRRALGELRSLAHDFPDQAEALNGRRREMLATFLSSPESNSVPALEYLGIIQDNTDVVPGSGADPQVQIKIVDHLLALDLQTQAASILQELLKATPPGENQAAEGVRLAELQLRIGNPAAALQTLTSSDSSGLPPDLVQQRTLTSARALASEGHRNEGLALLNDISTPPAIRLKADLQLSAQDWPAAAQSLTALASQIVPAAGPLNAAQRRLLLELAATMARADDSAGLEQIRSQYLARFAADPAARMFRDLTEPPIARTADLPRSAEEIQRARSLDQDLNAIR